MSEAKYVEGVPVVESNWNETKEKPELDTGKPKLKRIRIGLKGSSTKEEVCPKCSHKDNGKKRTFCRDDKGYWRCSLCNHKLGRDKEVSLIIPSMIMSPQVVQKAVIPDDVELHPDPRVTEEYH